MFYFSSLNLPMTSPSLPSTCLLQSCSSAPKLKHKNSYYNVIFNKANSTEISHVSGTSYCTHDHALIKARFFPSHSSLSVVARNAKGSGGEEDSRALETVLKLYTAIKDRDLDVLSDVIGEECRCVCNFVSAFQPWEGKAQALEFFSYLLRKLGEHIDFVVQPTFHDGMTVGVHWRLEWKETKITLGEGFSFYMCHVYHGKVLIKNVEMFMEPLLHIEPLRLKIMATIMAAIDKLGSTELSMDTAKGIIRHTLLAVLFLVAALTVILRFILY